jgi:hypothetical protein
VESGEYFGAKNPFLHVFNDDGTIRWSRELNRYPMIAGQFCEPCGSVPVIGDIDLDGHKEIFVDVGTTTTASGDVFPMYAFRDDGSTLAGNWPLDLPLGYSDKLLADVNADGWPELVVRSDRMALASGTVTRYSYDLYIINRFGAVLRTIKVPGSGVALPTRIPPVVGNFDADPELEIATYTAMSNGGCRPVVYDPRGYNLPGWPAPVDSYTIVALAAGDVDGCGRDELITIQTTDLQDKMVGASSSMTAPATSCRAGRCWPTR